MGHVHSCDRAFIQIFRIKDLQLLGLCSVIPNKGDNVTAIFVMLIVGWRKPRFTVPTMRRVICPGA
jgi:hypothetical protein